MKCQKCNSTDHELGAKYCHRCGTLLQTGTNKFKQPTTKVHPLKSINQKGMPSLTYIVNGVSFNMIKVEGGEGIEGVSLNHNYGGYCFYKDDFDSKYPEALTMDRLQTYSQGNFNWEKALRRFYVETFYIGETTVTQELWNAVMLENGGKHTDRKEISEFMSDWLKGNDLPITCNEGEENMFNLFIRKLNAITGWKFSFPSKDQWTYAARGGKMSKGFKYAGSNNLDDVGWSVHNSWRTARYDRDVHPVKTKLPNELGLYDMSGNVNEMCGSNGKKDFCFKGGSVFLLDYNSRVDIETSEIPYPGGLRLVLNNA